jgi:hypothetical protein
VDSGCEASRAYFGVRQLAAAFVSSSLLGVGRAVHCDRLRKVSRAGLYEIEQKNATPHLPSTCNDESGSKLPHSRSHLPRLEPDRGEFFEEEMKARVERASEKRS